MVMIFSSTQVKDLQVREAAYMCLSEVAGLYYEYLQPFMKELYQVCSVSRLRCLSVPETPSRFS
jgi:hypothetical protein